MKILHRPVFCVSWIAFAIQMFICRYLWNLTVAESIIIALGFAILSFLSLKELLDDSFGTHD